jgi:diguanylate cyclase (GGDEF)-like protein/PAS domain S-box-containing protein
LIRGEGSLAPDAQTGTGADGAFGPAFMSAPAGIALASRSGRVQMTNPAASELLGVAREELVGRSLADLCPSHQADAVRASIAALLGGESDRATHQLELSTQHGRHVLLSIALVRDGEGEPDFLVAHFQDVTSQVNSENARRESDRRFSRAFESAPIGMALVTLDGQLMLVNDELRALTGYDDDELLFCEPAHLAVPEDADRCKEALADALAGGGDGYRLEERWLNARGHQLWVAVSSALIRDALDRPLYFIWHVQDISDTRVAIDRLQHLADHDPLTQLFNRRRFESEVSEQIARSRRYGEEAVLLMIDLDDFKSVNDRFGHAAGDEMLRAVAETIRGRVRGTDLVARIAGDEFAVLLLHASEERGREVADELEMALRATQISAGESQVAAAASIGVAPLHSGGDDTTELFARADAEMFRRKQPRT